MRLDLWPLASIVILLLVGSSVSGVTGVHQYDPTKPILASMTWSPEKGYQLIDGKLEHTAETVAWANFTNAINQTGWSYLEVTTAEKFPDKIQVKN